MAKSKIEIHNFLLAHRMVRSGHIWYPAADVCRIPEGWLVKVELAGVSPEDVVIEVSRNKLFISGCRKDRACRKYISFHQMEITYSHFEKVIQLPASLENAQREKAFDNGILMIYIKPQQ